jgi:hypothetical protein
VGLPRRGRVVPAVITLVGATVGGAAATRRVVRIE